MPEGLDVIIVEDDEAVCSALSDMVARFYSWGEVVAFTNPDEAVAYCLNRDIGVAVFIVGVFLGDRSGFFFLDSVEKKFPTVHEDAIIIAGHAGDDVVDMCVASDVNYLIEKPVKGYALQLAVRSIVTKYMNFSKRMKTDPTLQWSMNRIEKLLSAAP